MRILGIDPGSSRIGYGLIEQGREIKIVKYGVIEIKEKLAARRLEKLGRSLSKLLGECSPDCAGVEQLYLSKNRLTALSVAEARGVIIKTLADHGITVLELNPNTIKKAVTGYGFAEKAAVAKMVKKILRVDNIDGYDDASDALAIAIAAGQVHNQ